MQLTRYTDYSLRVLFYLALPSTHLATIEEIAQAYGISKPHLMKAVHQLGRAGFLETLRGRGGGIRLARSPEEIVVGDVVRCTEGRMDLAECFDPATSRCRATSRWKANAPRPTKRPITSPWGRCLRPLRSRRNTRPVRNRCARCGA